jgi:hypothetical protein
LKGGSQDPFSTLFAGSITAKIGGSIMPIIDNPHDIISTYDLKVENNKKEVSEIWRNKVPQILGSNNYDVLLFYTGAVPREPYMELFLPILLDLKIDFIILGWPMMRDSGKIKVVAEMLEKGSSMNELKSILKYPEKLTFVPWKDKHY